MIHDETETQPKYWEPWQPKAGDRVRVKANAECPARTEHNRIEDIDGSVGTIHHVNREHHDGHFYYFVSDNGLVEGDAAAAELELLDGDS